jgi:hypothetical protein
MEGTGFVNVREKVIRVPLGAWPADKKMVRMHSRTSSYANFAHCSFYHAILSLVHIVGTTFEALSIDFLRLVLVPLAHFMPAPSRTTSNVAEHANMRG